ncbi:MAG: bifunctional (p)ppGpp synthetase/guanosine-3',5'-bis(diphosphate) 3'-pyrophosphohydrolase [Acidimicrobiales bacterium]|nr:bifunctional (p)ppGpp synthetase/guanosine-3',5'-bis(diphosphate) 3'-pyrophosphohydrolase [Acidimicrobiales bacterium]
MSSVVNKISLWDRIETDHSTEMSQVLELFSEHHPNDSDVLIREAYESACQAHTGQMRKSGDAYITHPVAVAEIIASLGLDEATVVSALLHDTVEDTGAGLNDIEKKFGIEVASIVDGVTKLDRIKFDTKEAQQAASMRKMLVAVAKDLRVLIIKLGDRLHNMRTIASLPQWKQHRIATETLDIYAPLAHRLGMQELKNELEDLAFATIHPKRYAEIDQMVAMRSPERDIYLTQVLTDVQARLDELAIGAEVRGRPKHFWSIYEKMVLKGREFDEIYDLVGIRVIVDSVKDCYGALGSIHATWHPVQGRFKDYIAMPKFNLYQSLHTTVIGPQGKPLEVQIRTKDMHHRAEHGVAAHFDYKGNDEGKDMTWFTRIVGWQQETEDPSKFMSNLKLDLDHDEVFVFTPNGEVVTLESQATPVDFAYTIHTEVGHSCRGARVNKRLVPLDTVLESGDTVEILTSKAEGSGPSQDWVRFVKTQRAASKIKQWFSRERREDAIDAGREALVAVLRKEGLPAYKLLNSALITEISELLNYQDPDSLFAAIGEDHVSAKSVVGRLLNHFEESEETDDLAAVLPTHRERQVGRAKRRRENNKVGVIVEGVDDIMVRLAKCCTPVPPDEIMGFVTRGRGVSIHRSDCANGVSLATGHANRLIDVEWDDDSDGTFVVSIEVKAFDRTRLLGDVSNILSEARVNIHRCTTRTGADRISVMNFEFEIGDSRHLDWLLSLIRQIDGVYDAYRIMTGHGSQSR